MNKYFDQDKNYLLREAQEEFQNDGLNLMVKVAVSDYLLKNNPLGLEDDFVLEIKSAQEIDTSFLIKPYEVLSAIYRMLHSDNQLSFVWNGRSHREQYSIEWSQAFTKWMHKFCQHSFMDKLIIKGAIINPGSNHQMLDAQIFKLIYQSFPIRRTKTGLLIAA
ncbi:MAG: hypothetical protein ACI8QD_001621 [Cyclobacteriaceae bacterium]|jgi:hypothetical protein